MDLIATHPQADFDGLAAMVAARKLYPDAALVLAGGSQEPVTQFVRDHDLNVSRLHDIDLSRVARVVLVDTQDPLRLEPLRPLWARPEVVVHVFDHHADGVDEPPSAAGPVIERRMIDRVGATTTLVYELVNERALPVTPFEATVLAIGIYEETGSLTYGSTTPRDVDAVAALLRAGADLSVVAATLRKAIVPEQVALLNDLLGAADTHYLEGLKVLVTSSPAEHYRGDVAAVVAMMMRVEGVDAVLAACTMDHKIEIVGRSRRPEVDVSWIAREFGGGGHAAAAAATVKGSTLIEVRERLTRLLLDRYRPTLLAKDVMTRPVKTIAEDQSIEEAGRLMTTAGVTVFPVVDRRGRYLGLISRETVQKASFHALGRSPVSSFMRTDQYAGTPDTPFHDVERHMIEGHQRLVPVLVDSKVVGVITRTDLLRTLHDDVLRGARARLQSGLDATANASVHQREMSGILRERLPSPVVALLRSAGELGDRREVQLYLVGGVVRDLFLGRSNTDVDIVVEGDGVAFAKAFAAEQQARVTVHERFGTARLTFRDGCKLDIATARTEYYERPTALPTVELGSIKRDLFRRDFTINTLAIRLNAPVFGRLLDFYGAERDLKDRLIRVLHSLSFVEDPTRVFRAVRFAVRFGFELGRETRALITGAVRMDLITKLSPHRVTEELRLVLSEREPRAAVAMLAELGVLRSLHPALAWSARLQSLLRGVEDAVAWYRLLYLDHRMESWLVYLSALLGVLPDKAASAMLARLELSEREASVLRLARFSGHRLLRRLMGRPGPRPSEVAHALNGIDDEPLLFLMASTRSDPVKRRLSAYLTDYRKIRPLLTGGDLKHLGVPPGPDFTRVLTALRAARLDGYVVSVEDERQFVKRWFAPKSRKGGA